MRRINGKEETWDGRRWLPVVRDEPDEDQRAATDREIVRVVRDWWDSPTAYDSDLIKRVSTLLTKEGEGTR